MLATRPYISGISGPGGTYRLPRKDDHFTVTTLHRDKDGALIPDKALMAELAQYADPDGKIRQLPVCLLSDDLEDVIQTAWVWYVGKKVAARSDGVTLTRE